MSAKTLTRLSKYSFGVGDRFGHQAKAQLKAIQLAREEGVTLTPVWNKSHREHQIIGSQPSETRREADLAVDKLGWNEPYFVDADHISMRNVDFFTEDCDFFTIDVADSIGKRASKQEITGFCKAYGKYLGEIELADLGQSISITPQLLEKVAGKYLFAAQEAGRIYRHIAARKAGARFVVEVSMDETDEAQTPDELFLILAALADENIPLQTVAPKFTGRFNKGVDYVGDLSAFKSEFEQDMAVVKLAISEFGLSDHLKLSVHSGSDKFSIYPIIREALVKFDAGLHIKTAGTTWLEELIGLAEAEGQGLQIAKDIYGQALTHIDELCAPYATVIDIDLQSLPSFEVVSEWDGATFAATLRHDQRNPRYNPHFRQLLHVGYKLAARMGSKYLSGLEENQDIIAKNVTANIFERHIQPLFL